MSAETRAMLNQRLKGPGGKAVDADIEITQLEPNRLVGFRAIGGPVRPEGRYELAEEGELLVALDTSLTPELEAEGLAREVAHRLQGLRKAAGYDLSDRISAAVGGDPELLARLEPHRAWLARELLADALTFRPEGGLDQPDRSEELELHGGRLRLAVRRA